MLLLFLLQAQTEAKTIAALQSLVEEASAFAPCMLALKHFTAITGQAGAIRGGGWKNGGQGFSVRGIVFTVGKLDFAPLGSGYCRWIGLM